MGRGAQHWPESQGRGQVVEVFLSSVRCVTLISLSPDFLMNHLRGRLGRLGGILRVSQRHLQH